MSELLPCPFCGKQPEIGHYETFDNDEWWIGCNCECGPCTRVSFTYEQAIVAWNSRAERTCHIANLGGLAGSVPLFMCAECDSLFYGNAYGEAPNYCPNCGAKVVDE